MQNSSVDWCWLRGNTKGGERLGFRKAGVMPPIYFARQGKSRRMSGGGNSSTSGKSMDAPYDICDGIADVCNTRNAAPIGRAAWTPARMPPAPQRSKPEDQLATRRHGNLPTTARTPHLNYASAIATLIEPK
jgi:hypothetical protein